MILLTPKYLRTMKKILKSQPVIRCVTRLKITMIFLLSSTWYLVIVYLKLHIKLKVKSWNWPKYVFIWRMHDSNYLIEFNCTLLKYSQPTSFQLSVIFLLFLPSTPTFLKEIDLIVTKCFPLLFLVMFFKHEWWPGARTNRMMINGIVFHVPCWHSPKGRKKKQSRPQYRVWRENMDIQ